MIEQIGQARAPAYSLRVGNLAEAASVTAVCIICRHEAPLDVAELVKRFGVHHFVKDVIDKLYCTDCKGKHGLCGVRVVWPV